jgi:hypothetical protein
MPRNEIRIWEVKRQRLSRAEPKLIHVRIGGEVFEVKGRLHRRSGDRHASLYHVINGKYFLANFADLAVAIKQGRIKKLNEMEVLAWVAE